jgi:tetratricopeptide (TPR) repeat protein
MNRLSTMIIFLVCVLLFSVCAHAADDPEQLFEKAVTAFNDGRYDEAVSLWEQALPLYKKSGDTEHEAMVLNNIGLVNFYTRQYDEAVGYFKQALAIDRKREISRDVATDLQNLGLAYFRLGEYNPALSAFKESAAVFDTIGDINGTAANLQQSGLTEFALGEYAEAGRYFITASDLHRGVRDRKGYAIDLMGLGDTYAALDRFDKALENYEEALKVREVLGEVEPYVATRIRIARAFADNGRYDEALEYLKQAQKDAKEAKSDPLMGDIASAWAEVLNSSGDADGALAAFDEALALMKKGNDLSGAGMALTNRGIILSELLRFSEAEKSFDDALLIYQVTKDPRNEAKVLINLGNLANEMGDLDGAFSFYTQAETLLNGDKGGAISGVNYLGIGEVYLKKKEFKKARAAFGTAGKLLTGERDKRYSAKIDAYFGLLDYYEGDYVSSIGRFNKALTILRKENARTLVADILVGTGMAIIEGGRPDVASGYFAEAKRLADDLVIGPVGWRAVYGDGLLKETADDKALAMARYEDALFRLSGMPDIVPTLYGSRIVTIDDLLDRLSSGDADKTGMGQFDRTRVKDNFERIAGLFTDAEETRSAKDEKLVERVRNAIGKFNYLEKRLADDEYRKGNNTELFSKKLLGAQGEYLKVLDDIRNAAPELWDECFSGLYE